MKAVLRAQARGVARAFLKQVAGSVRAFHPACHDDLDWTGPVCAWRYRPGRHPCCRLQQPQPRLLRARPDRHPASRGWQPCQKQRHWLREGAPQLTQLPVVTAKCHVHPAYPGRLPDNQWMQRIAVRWTADPKLARRPARPPGSRSGKCHPAAAVLPAGFPTFPGYGASGFRLLVGQSAWSVPLDASGAWKGRRGARHCLPRLMCHLSFRELSWCWLLCLIRTDIRGGMS